MDRYFTRTGILVKQNKLLFNYLYHKKYYYQCLFIVKDIALLA